MLTSSKSLDSFGDPPTQYQGHKSFLCELDIETMSDHNAQLHI